MVAENKGTGSVNAMLAFKKGTVDFISEAELSAKLQKKKVLRVKLGFDPTVSDLHLGHTVVMQKLRQFQEAGHQIIFLIGDYTAQIGDPSGRDKTRPTLTEKEVTANAKTYLAQAFKILDKKKTEVRRNSEWMKKQTAMNLVALAGEYNVARMLERDDFRNRFQEGQQITIREFLYPLIQGYDSVALKADVELGGQDQKFNLAVARDVQRAYGQEPEVIITVPLLIGTDGQKKMSKSYGNYIGVTESPKEMFGKIMGLTDELMWHYYELLTDVEVAVAKQQHPKAAKINLAKILVERFHSKIFAEQAAEEFEKIFSKGEKPVDIEEVVLPSRLRLIDLLVSQGLASSKSDARRLIQQGGVRLDDQKVSDSEMILSSSKPCLLQVGKRRFLRIRFKN